MTAVNKKIPRILLFLLSVFLYGQENFSEEIPFSPVPGVYGTDVEVSLPGEGPDRYQYRFVSSRSSNWVDYLFPLRLTALPGEERIFQIQVRKIPASSTENNKGNKGRSSDSANFIEYTYIIDRSAPPMPEITLEGSYGKYQARLTAGKLVNPGADTSLRSDEKIYYWISEFGRDEFRPYTGGTFPLEGGSLLKAFSVDRVGNHSKTLTRKIEPFFTGEDPGEIEVPSPVRGTFVNSQWFVVANPDCFEWIRYTVDGTDPVLRGAAYSSPVLIRKEGNIYLQVAAKKYHSEDVLNYRVRFTIDKDPAENITITAGEQQNFLEKYPFPGKHSDFRFYYSLEDRDVTTRDRELQGSVSASATEGTLNYLVYRVGAYHTETGRMYQMRSFYTIDRRVPAPPVIDIAGALPFSREVSVKIKSSRGAQIYYTIDGTSPDRYSNRYSEAVTVRPSSGLDIGTINLQAVARYANGNTSDVSSKLLPFDRRYPPPPTYTISQKSSGGAVFRLDHQESDVKFLYRLVYSETAGINIDENSPECGRILRLNFPYGYQGKARLRFAVMDRAGNISQPTSIEEIQVDTVPPPPPAITIEDTILRIYGEGNLFYRIESVNKEYIPYSRSIRLDVPEGSKTEYRIFAYSEDEEGNRSSSSEQRITYDRRKSVLPKVLGLRDGAYYSDAVEIRIINSFSDLVTHYRLKKLAERSGSSLADREGMVDGEADGQTYAGDDALLNTGSGAVGVSDPEFSEPLILKGKENSEIRYSLSLRTHLPGSDSWSETAEYNFTIDRIAPEEIDLSSVISPGIFNDTVTIVGDNPSLVEEVWVYATEDPISREERKTPEQIREKGKTLRTGIELQGEKGKEKLYYLYAAVFDTAGNSTASGPFEVTVDMMKPEVPMLAGLPADRSSSDSITIAKRGDYPYEVVYEITSDFSMPVEPTSTSTKLNQPLVLEKKGEDGTIYTLIYRGLDRAGNLSESGIARLILDETSPSSPEIQIEMIDRRRSVITLSAADGSILMYSINGAAFREYELPFFHISDENSAELKIEAYGRDASGRKGPVVSKRIQLSEYTNRLVEGVVDGKMYNHDLRITPTRSDLDIRYILQETRKTPPLIGPDAPRIGDGIDISVQEGSEKNFILLVGYIDENSGVVTGTMRFEFMIDRASPPPPNLVGLEDNAYYTEDRFFKLESESERTVLYYRVGENREAAAPFRRYTQQEQITVRPGVRKDFYIEYRAEDTAGNSSKIENTHFVIDKAGIYVSENGDDRFSGGKNAPFKTLDRAIFEAVQTNRNTIYMTSGEYTISEPIKVGTQLTLRGGYKQDDWNNPGSENSLISPAVDYESAGGMFELRDGTLRLDHVLISNQGLAGPIIDQDGDYSNLIVRNSRFVHADGTLPSLIDSKKGNLLIADTTIEVGPTVSGRILTLREADLALRDTKVLAGDGSRNISLLSIEKGHLEILSSDFEIGSASTSVNLSSIDSDVTIENSTFRTGAGSVKSTGIYQRRGSLTIRNSVIGLPDETSLDNIGGRYARIASGIEIESARVEISKTILNSRGTNGIVQLSSSSGSLVLSDSNLVNTAVSEFSYLLRSSGGSCSITNTRFEAGPADEIAAIDSRDRSVLMLRSSSLKISRGTRSAVGIKVGGDVIGTIQENLFVGTPGGAESTAVEIMPVPGTTPVIAPDIGLKLIENRFSGWSYLVTTGKEKVSGIDLLEMERPPFDRKNPHRGNSIR